MGEVAVVSLRGLLKPPEGEGKLQFLVRAEGPTRVLSVTDLQVAWLSRHTSCSLALQDASLDLSGCRCTCHWPSHQAAQWPTSLWDGRHGAAA